jgi:hypothetical protein
VASRYNTGNTISVSRVDDRMLNQHTAWKSERSQTSPDKTDAARALARNARLQIHARYITV